MRLSYAKVASFADPPGVEFAGSVLAGHRQLDSSLRVVTVLAHSLAVVNTIKMLTLSS